MCIRYFNTVDTSNNLSSQLDRPNILRLEEKSRQKIMLDVAPEVRKKFMSSTK